MTRATFVRMVPIVVVLSLVAAFFALGLQHKLSLETLRDNRAALLAFVDRHPLTAALGFAGAYTLVVALSVPGAAIFSLSGGLLFGLFEGAILNILSAAIGATLLFLLARYAVGDRIKARAGPFLKRMSEGFERHAFNYLLFLRLIPVFPFWAVNLAPALLGVPLRTFILGTILGIIPGTLAYTAFGSGLGLLFDAGAAVDPSTIFTPQRIALHVGLGLLALLPLVFQWVRNRRLS